MIRKKITKCIEGLKKKSEGLSSGNYRLAVKSLGYLVLELA